MRKKWKKSLQIAVLTTVLTAYVTIGHYAVESIKQANENKQAKNNTNWETQQTLKTIVGFSFEYRLNEEMRETFACDWSESESGESGSEKSGWQFDETTGVALLSAYYDSRLNPYKYIRIIGLVPKDATLFCHVWLGSETGVMATRARVDRVWNDHWGSSSQDGMYPSLVSCLTPREVAAVSLASSPCMRSNLTVRLRTPEPKRHNKFTVCVKPLELTEKTAASLDEWLQLNRVLGAGKITVYITHLNQPVMNILKSYVRKKFVEIVRVEQLGALGGEETFEELLWRKRKMEVVAYNDCFYRSLTTTKFIIPLDVDELIVPRVGDDWAQMCSLHFKDNRLLSQYASFSVQNVYFFANYPNTATFAPSTQPVDPFQLVNNQTTIFRRKIRSLNFSPSADSTKSFIQVSNALTVFNHYAFHTLRHSSRQYVIPQSVAQLNHYRVNCDSRLIDGCQNFLNNLIVDNILDKFLEKIRLLQ